MLGGISIVISLPLNDALTSLLIYEGLVYLMSKTPVKVEGNKVTIPRDGIAKVYRELSDETLNKINVTTVGKNDDSSLKRFIDWLGISKEELEERLASLYINERRRKRKLRITNYQELLYILKHSFKKLKISTDTIFVGTTIGKKHIIIGEVKGDKGLSFQFLKSERYTGLTSTEHEYTTRQITTYVSPEVLLLAMLGLYSSFVYRNANTYYFLFLSPLEIGEILFSNNNPETMMRIKDKARDILEQVIKRQFKEELLAAEICLNTKLQEVLGERDVKSISLLLLKVNQEGQTYKVYETIPFTIFFREAKEVYRLLEKIIAPDGIVLERLRNSDNVEHSNLMSVIIGLYRFVILDDRYGIYQALRELHNAYVKVGGDEKLRWAALRYEALLREVSTLERYL